MAHFLLGRNVAIRFSCDCSSRPKLSALSATGRKCRAERAKVLEVIGDEVGVSRHDKNFTYKVGQWVRSDEWDDNRWNECSSGIHFFLTRVEAENYE